MSNNPPKVETPVPTTPETFSENLLKIAKASQALSELIHSILPDDQVILVPGESEMVELVEVEAGGEHV